MTTLLANFQMLGGSIGGAGGVTSTKGFEWSAGTITGSGGLTNMSPTFSIVGSGMVPAGYGSTPDKTISNGVLLNRGTIRQSGNGQVAVSDSGVLSNGVGAVYELQDDSGLSPQCYSWTPWSSYYSSSGRIDNAGLFLKSGGTGQSTVGVAFNNTGTLEVDSGTLAFNGGFTQTAGCDAIGWRQSRLLKRRFSGRGCYRDGHHQRPPP